MANETHEIIHDNPVVIARTASLGEADVICAVLRTDDIETFILNENTTQLFPHMDVAINPKGIQIAVRQSDQQAAQQQLEKHGSFSLPEVKQDAPVVEGNLTDRFARAAAVSGVFAVLVNLFIIITVWYYFRAISSAEKLPPTDNILFRRNMKIAKICLIIAAIVLFGLVVYFATGEFSWLPSHDAIILE